MEEELEEPIEEVKEEAKPEEIKRGFNFRKWLKGKNKREYVENISFIIIVISGILVALGIGLGSFIEGTVLIASFGSFFVMVGIVTYIISQFIEVEHG